MPAHKSHTSSSKKFQTKAFSRRGFGRLVKKVVVWGVISNMLIPYGMVSGLWGSNSMVGEVKAANKTLTQRVDWKAGELVNTETESKNGSIQLMADGRWETKEWKTPQWAFGTGGAYTSDGQYVYATPGEMQNKFLRYQPANDEWKIMADIPQGVYSGSDMVYLNGYIYLLPGSYQESFYRYTVATNTWTQMANFPDLITTNGTALTSDGTNLWAIKGGTREMYLYEIASNTWIPKPPFPNSINYGDLVYYNGFIYGNDNNGPARWYKYNVSTGVSTRLADAPGSRNYDLEYEIYNGYVYVLRGAGTTDFWRFNLTTEVWETIASLPQTTQIGGGVVYSPTDGYLYVFRGAGTYDWWKYDIAGNRFLGPTDAPASVGNGGSDLTKVGNKYYVHRGGNTLTMYEYDFVTGVWTQKADSPDTIDGYNRPVSDGRYIYYFRGRNLVTVYRYDTQGNTWTTLADAPGTVSGGGVMMYPGTGDYIYATRGNWASAFWRYTISTNTWSDPAVADLPSVTVDQGAAVATVGNSFYVQGGLGISRFLRYDIDTNTWTELTNTPYAPVSGTDLAYDGVGKIYALGGNWDTDVWVYTIATNSWKKVPSIPSQYGYERGAGGGAAIEGDGLGNYYVLRGNSNYVLKFVPTNYDYVTSGTWTSAINDFKYVSSWTAATITKTTPGNSSVTVQSRSSADMITWSDWQDISGTTISSPANRYLQFKATLSASTDRTSSPTLEEISVDYVGDETAPGNPNVISAVSQTVGGTPLVSGNTYSFSFPSFSWSGATDVGQGVAGYYVYFGNEADADPTEKGAYQTGTSYVVTYPLKAESYYLKIKTKDLAGNISGSAWTAFIYNYTGIPSEKSIIATTTADFNLGQLSSIQPWNDQIKLASRSAGLWLEDYGALAPSSLSYGSRTSAYVAETNKMYFMRGNNSQEMYEYDLSTEVWTTLANTPAAVYVGGGLVEGPSGYLYAFQGNTYSTFWRYSILENSWSDVDAADAPNTTYYGSSMVYDGSRYIYALRGNNDDAFWKYDTLSNVWETLPSADFGTPERAVNNMVYFGGDLSYDGMDTIYAIQGNLRAEFASYSISQKTWTVLPDAPMPFYNGSSIGFDATTNAVYATAGNSRLEMFKYNIGTQTWTRVSDAPASIGYGSDMRKVGDYFYISRGNGTQTIFKYKIATDSWMVPTRGIFGNYFYGASIDTVGNKGVVIKGDGNNLYMVRGNFGNDFARYNYETGEITRLANLPTGSYYGTALTYVPSTQKVYYISYGIRKFFVYSIATDTWSEDDIPPVNPNGYGSVLVNDGSRYIYWTRGQSSNFYRFDTQGVSGSKWSTLANLSNIDNGGDVVYKNGYIYALRGSATLSFYRYNVSTNVWSDTDVADVPAAYRIYYGGALADGFDGYLYAMRGENTRNFLRYSIAGDRWEVLPNLPGNVTYGGSLASNGSNRLFAFMPGTNSYADGLYNYVQTTDTTGFVESGTYISPSYDLEKVYKYSNVRVSYTSAAATTLKVETRSSVNGSTWEAWQETSSQKVIGSTYEYKINSTAARYLQLRFTLKSDNGVYSGSIQDYSINYVQDLAAPANPVDAGFKAYSTSTQSAELISGNWYPHTAPQFNWSAAETEFGATDTATGSGVVGYYTSFTATNSADPAVVGTLQTGNVATMSGLVSGTVYNFALKTVDDAGNVASETWRPFVYKFDNVNPTQPDDLSADPSGYSAVNKFAFSWGQATDSASGVAGYCYKTGATTGIYSTEQCTTDLSILDVPSYKKGANTFYLRAKDNAGNYSATSTISYYFNDDSPSPPRSLTVSPETSETNSFVFSWSSPEVYYGNISNLRYFYSVNALPSVANAQETVLTRLSAGPYATLPGENTFYIVAKDEAGNIDFKQYATVSFFANTPAPGMPENMDVADVSVKATKAWKIAITWQQPTSGGENVASYQVWRSDDGGATYKKIASTAGISYVDTGLSQLTYYYKVKACDSANNCGAYGAEVTQYPDGKFIVPAELVDEPEASNMTTKKATISWTTGRTADSKIAYGVESGKYIDTEVGNSDQVMSHKLVITNLAPGTKYYYVAKWSDEDGNLGISDELTFETDAAPSAKEVKAVNIGLDKATINFTSSGADKVMVVYGKSTAFGGSAELAISPTEATYGVYLEGLEDGTKYYYRVDLFDVDGAVYPGDIYSFETLPRPKISNVKLQQVKGSATSTLLITWASNTEISSIATYYPSINPSMVRDEVDIKMSKAHKTIVKGLLPNTAYTLIIKGRDKGGNEAISEAQSFTTASDTRPPEISNLNTEMTIQGVGEEATAQLIVSWETDELSTSQVMYGEGSTGTLSNKTQADTLPVYTHLVVIQNLVPSKVYRLRAVSADPQNNIAESNDTVIITPKASQSALNLVVGNLSQAFGFLGGLVGTQ